MFDLMRWPSGTWSILEELDALQRDMNRTFSELGFDRSWNGGTAYPPLNVWSSGDGIVVDAELPGVEPGEVEVSVVNDELTLRGRVNPAEPRQGETYHRRERPAGDFVRTIRLPFRANAEGVKAQYRNGLLRVTVPRAEEDKPKRIAVEAA